MGFRGSFHDILRFCQNKFFRPPEMYFVQSRLYTNTFLPPASKELKILVDHVQVTTGITLIGLFEDVVNYGCGIVT